jgi:hypothetical protein
MNFSNTNQRKYFPKIFIRRPVYIFLLLLFFLITSIVVQQVQSIMIERLEKHIFNDKIPIPAEAISYADSYSVNMFSRQILKHHPDFSSYDQALFVIINPVDNGNNETNVLVTIIEPDFTDLPEDVFYTQLDTKTEFAGNLVQIPEEKSGLKRY